MGDLAAAVVGVASEQDARLIVIEDAGRESERLLALPWDHVSHNAPCDVLIVRAPGAPAA